MRQENGADWKAAAIDRPPLGAAGWLRVLVRGGAVAFVTYGCLLLLLALRLVERPLYGPVRPWTPHITQFVCRVALRLMRLPLAVRGKPMAARGAVVANHASWLDIFTLNAVQRVYFVAKAEVRQMGPVGWLAAATGTVFIARKGTEAKVQQQMFEDRIRAGHRLLFFPEGTSTDALRVLPFKSTLFAAFWTHGLEHVMAIQPVTVIYHAPEGEDPRFYGWWGDQGFGEHLLMVLGAKRQGRVEVIFHDPVAVDAFRDRKELAAYCEEVVRAAHPLAR